MLWVILAGVASGIISGLGIGGGVILIPILVMLLNVAQQTAQGVNLLYFIPTAIIALVIHFKNKLVDKKLAVILAISGILGALAGSFVAVRMQNGVLQKIFAGFLLIIGLVEIFKKQG